MQKRESETKVNMKSESESKSTLEGSEHLLTVAPYVMSTTIGTNHQEKASSSLNSQIA